MLTIGESGYGNTLYYSYNFSVKSEIVIKIIIKNFKGVQDTAPNLVHKCFIKCSFQIFYTDFQMTK